MDMTIYDVRAELLKAMAHPARLQMIDALAEGDKCVGDLQEVVGSALPTVSRHLARMKACGIVSRRRDGNCVYYSLLVPCILDIFDCVDRAVSADAQRKTQACRAEPDREPAGCNTPTSACGRRVSAEQ